eukprot:444530-Amphidinium_carterae.1
MGSFTQTASGTGSFWVQSPPKRGRKPIVSSTLIEKLTTVVHSLLEAGACLSIPVLQQLFAEELRRCGIERVLSKAWMHNYLHSIGLKFKAGTSSGAGKDWASAGAQGACASTPC